ncbi:MAG TPA: hypothetical protein VHI13_19380 [Candidatus Kapabacteria bacterium]|nr:hypothetical protein [Candidatus Kapabacteria bacterium]
MPPPVRTLLLVLLMILSMPCLHAQPANWQRDIGFPSGDAVTGMIALDDGTLIVGTATNGIYIAPVFGAAWTAASNGLASKKIRSLVITNTNALIAGTADRGVFRSDDGGETWAPSNSGMTGTEIDNIGIAGDGTIYTASDRGVHASSDDGHTWTSLGPPGKQIWTLAAGANATIYAATPTVGTYRSVDRGRNWTPMTLNASGILVMKVAPGGAVFAGASSIYRSTDGGSSWTTIPVNTDLISAMEWNGRGHMFIGAVDGVYRSTDNGTTWSPFADGMDRGTVSTLAITRDGVLYAGTFGGRLYRTGSSTSDVEFAAAGAYIPAVRCSVAPDPVHIFARIGITCPASSRTEVSLCDAIGQRLQLLCDEELSAGTHEIPLDATGYPSGTYFCRIDCGGRITILPLVIAH